MKTRLLSVLLVCLYNTSYSQLPGGFEIFLADTVHLDSGQVLVEGSIVDKLIFEKPATLTKSTPLGPIIDEKARKVRHQVRGAFNLLVYPRADLRLRYQPHFFLEVNGLTTYISTNLGIGITDRDLHVSYGIFGGSYIRRVDEYTDFSFRASNFEYANLWGAYGFWDYRDATLFLSYAREKGKTYYARGVATLKLGQLLKFRGVLEGVRVHAEYETFLGTGGGISYQVKWEEFAMGFACTYLIPDRGEQKIQRLFNNFLGEGLGVKLSLLWF